MKKMKTKTFVIFAAIAIGTLLTVGPAVAEASEYGKLEPVLYDRLQTMAADEMIKVVIWLTPIDSKVCVQKALSKYPSAEVIGNRPIGKDADNIRSEMFQEKKKAYALKEQPVIDFIEGKGFKVKYASTTTPTISAELPESVIYELEKRPDVDTIYLSKVGGPEINTAVPTICVPYVRKKGYDGTGVKVAVVEGDGIDFNNPHLNGLMRPGQTDVGQHATIIGGIIASTNNDYKGVAHDVTLLSANADSWDDDDEMNASDWAIGEGAKILSCSFWTTEDSLYDHVDRYYDQVVYEHFVAVVKSAGNDAVVTSPGNAYNVITVGGTDDKQTKSWKDDIRAPFSSYEEEPGDRNKPEVSAVAVGIRSTETSGYHALTGSWITRLADIYDGLHNGTSFAAPQVAGEIALLIDMDPALSAWPEATKAIVMATAIHNTYDARIDDKEGVGTIVVSKAYNTVKNHWYDYDAVIANDFPMEKTFHVDKEQYVRYVITWTNKSYPTGPGGTLLPNNLPANLNLEIFDPGGNSVAKSNYDDNNYEIAEFTAKKSGTYKAKITKQSFTPSVQFLGVAWFRKEIIESANSTGGRKDVFVKNATVSEKVYAIGSGYPPSETYDLYIVNDTKWRDGMKIPDHKVKTTVTTDANGKITPHPALLIWSSPEIGKYDIIVDVNNSGIYDNCTDVLDDLDVDNTAGFEVVPEFATIAIPVAAIIGLLFLFSRRRRKE